MLEKSIKNSKIKHYPRFYQYTVKPGILDIYKIVYLKDHRYLIWEGLL